MCVTGSRRSPSYARSRHTRRRHGPIFVLLDLNMPRLGGREVLTAIKSDPLLCSIPVIVLTTSNASEDVFRSYELHVNSYVRKPLDFDQFVAVMQSIERFWIGTAELPSLS